MNLSKNERSARRFGGSRRTFQLFGSAILAAISFIAGCSTDHDKANQKTPAKQTATTFKGEYPIKIGATVGMVADLARTVGGSHVAVTQILGSGVDPHLYKASRDDVSTIMQSDVVYYSGLMLEGKMDDTLQKLGQTQPVFAVTGSVSRDRQIHDTASAGLAAHADPHVWMDVSMWSECVNTVTDSLSSFDPAHAADYKTNADKLQSQLKDLHEYGRQVVASIPNENRVLITSHDAFGYFGRAYGIEVEGIQGISTDSEAGLRRINELVDLIVNRKIPAVFVESSVPRKSIEALVDGAGSRGHRVVISGPLFSDAMGDQGTYEGTYPGMLDHNFTMIARSLGGTAPERGWQGKLAEPTH
jgi:manganese/zinc/iron transport system substrate-binding protein